MGSLGYGAHSSHFTEEGMQLSSLQVSVSSLLSDVCVCASLASGCLNFFHIGTIYIETFYMILGLIGIYNKYTNQTFTHNNHKNIYFKKLVYI